MSVGKIRTLEEITALRAEMKASGQKLVWTNGCFDLLHVGHVRYLNQARALGDILVVGVNSDRSIHEIKGPERPIIPEAERVEILAALECVDYVIVFDDATPQRIIDALVPDVLVKGADWHPEKIVGRETVERAGGVICNLPLVEGTSTTEIIRKILQNYGQTAANRRQTTQD